MNIYDGRVKDGAADLAWESLLALIHAGDGQVYEFSNREHMKHVEHGAHGAHGAQVAQNAYGSCESDSH